VIIGHSYNPLCPDYPDALYTTAISDNEATVYPTALSGLHWRTGAISGGVGGGTNREQQANAKQASKADDLLKHIASSPDETKKLGDR